MTPALTPAEVAKRLDHLAGLALLPARIALLAGIAAFLARVTG